MEEILETITLEITQDSLYNFFSLYDTLSPLRQKIWQLAVWWVKRFPIAKPSQTKIAETARCSRSAVNEAFSLFKSYGWLSLQSRGIKRTKIMFIPEHLKMIDLSNRQWFKRVEATYKATHSLSNNRKNTSRAGEIQIPEYLKKKDLPLEVKLKLSLVPEHIYQETYYQCQKRFKAGFRPDNDISYFVGTAIKMAEKNGIKINWRSYYGTLRGENEITSK